MPVKSAPAKSPNRTNFLASAFRKPVDHHIDADVDAGAHAVRGAELGHPHEHVDAKLLRPRQIDLEQPVLHDRNRHARGVAVDDGDEDQQRGAAHQERDQPLLEVVENLARRSSAVFDAPSSKNATVVPQRIDWRAVRFAFVQLTA